MVPHPSLTLACALFVSAASASAQSSAPPPAPVTGVEIRVDVAPPSPKAEVRPVRPAADNLWAPGYWRFSTGTWVWMGGRWIAPHATHRHYVPTTWVKKKGYWVMRQGGFASKPGGRVVVAYRHPLTPRDRATTGKRSTHASKRFHVKPTKKRRKAIRKKRGR